MRAFIAIHFPKEVQMALYQRVQDLKKASIRGHFTRDENMHLTLAFLGEIASERVEEVIKIMNQVASEHTSFEMKWGGLGKFASRGEGLYWCGIEEKPPTSMKVAKINLMKSEHIEGKLIYSSLGEVRLQE